MKAITLTQPWATLMAIGAKTLETRGWATKYRGPIAIHAAKAWDSSDCEHEPFRSVLMAAGYDRDEKIPRGAILAIAELVNCIPTTYASFVNRPPHEEEFGNYGPGRYAFDMRNVFRLVEPIPCRGALSLWDTDIIQLANYTPKIQAAISHQQNLLANPNTADVGK